MRGTAAAVETAIVLITDAVVTIPIIIGAIVIIDGETRVGLSIVEDVVKR